MLQRDLVSRNTGVWLSLVSRLRCSDCVSDGKCGTLNLASWLLTNIVGAVWSMTFVRPVPWFPVFYVDILARSLLIRSFGESGWLNWMESLAWFHIASARAQPCLVQLGQNEDQSRASPTQESFWVGMTWSIMGFQGAGG